ncbi:hypothetical protein [Micromonospora globbae]|uniref:hypothetical protein n=1 Tax=Micromonospora globbae TaxID=1894969 RepID=UPI0034400907
MRIHLTNGGTRLARRLLRPVLAAGLAALLAAAATPAAAAPAAVTLAPGSVTPAVITAGQPAVQTINLSRKAPSGGVWVDLYGDVVYGAVTGRSVYVPAGQRSVSFPIRVSAAATAEVVRPLHAQVPGSDVTKVAEVTVRPADPAVQAVTSLDFDQEVVLAGTSVTGTVSLLAPASAGGLNLDVWANTSYGPSVSVPPLVVVPEGATTATFTGRAGAADEPTVVRPSATLGGTRAAGRVAVLPTTFAVGPSYVRRGAATETAVSLGVPAGPDGAVVALAVDVPGVSVPATVTVPAGSPGVIFEVTVAADAPTSQLGTITATWDGQTVSRLFVVG